MSQRFAESAAFGNIYCEAIRQFAVPVIVSNQTALDIDNLGRSILAVAAWRTACGQNDAPGFALALQENDDGGGWIFKSSKRETSCDWPATASQRKRNHVIPAVNRGAAATCNARAA
jgi:hypothetical protein